MRLVAVAVAVTLVGAAGEIRLAVAQDDVSDAAAAKRTALEVSTELLLEKLVEQGDKGMHDVVLWVLDRVDADDSLKSLRPSSPLRRGGSLVSLSRKELDTKKKAGLLEEALKCFDVFLAAKAGDAEVGNEQIMALTEKGGVLVERARLAVAQSKLSGADPAASLEAAVKFFDEAFASFEAAEKGVLVRLRSVGEQLAAFDVGKKADGADAKDGGKEGKKAPPPRKGRSTADQKRDAAKVEELSEEQERLRGQLLSTRLLLASARFEKSKAFAPGSEGWKQAMDDSTKRYAELYTKYGNRGVGLFARYYEGRNYTVMAQAAEKPDDRKKLLEKAVQTLVELRLLEGGGFVPALKAKAYNTTFECWMELNDVAGFDEAAEKAVAAAVSPDKYVGIDGGDWLGMKYRGAALLAQKAEAEGPKGRPKLKTAQKAAMEVAKVNRDYAKEARELLTKLGKSVGEEQAQSFEAAMDEVGVIVGNWKSKSTEAKELEKASKADEAGKAKEEAAAFRDKAIQSLVKAMPTATDEDLDRLNKARYLTTFLLYDAKRLHEAAALGEFLAERYPNAIGSKDAARVAMASWQMLAKEGQPGWSADARRRSAELAGLIVKIWPADGSSADAAVVAIASAAEQGDVKRIMDLVEAVPADSPRRAEVLLRGGSALWKAVVDRRRLGDDAQGDAAEQPVENVLGKATQAIDAGLGAVAAAGKPDKLAVAAALYRCQIGMEAGDDKLVLETLTNPVYGPWTVVTSGDASVVDPAVAEEALRLALRYFIQTEKLDDAQKAMDLLEAAAGEGEDAAEKLASMYLAMGRDLQEQLAGILGGAGGIAGGAGGIAGGEVSGEARARAGKVVSGLVKFLDRVAAKDKKVSSQMWVASQFMALGAGPGQQGAAIVQVVSKDKRQEYLARAAAIYESLLKSDDQKIKDSELSIRLKLATVYRELERWDEAIGHLEWIVRQPKGANMLSAQWEAATFLAAAGAVEKDKAKAVDYLKQAVMGRQGEVVFWGWSGIANKLQKQALAGGANEKAAESRRRFFEARLNVPKTRLTRAEVGEAADRTKQLEMAERDIVLTHKLYPDMGGKEFRGQFDKLLEEIQKQLDRPSKRGVDDLDAELQAEQAQKPAE